MRALQNRRHIHCSVHIVAVCLHMLAPPPLVGTSMCGNNQQVVGVLFGGFVFTPA
jgi:hypothetical protein